MGTHHPLGLGVEIQAERMQEGCPSGEGLYPTPSTAQNQSREPRESRNEKIMNGQDGLFVNVCEINEQRLLHNTEGMKSIPSSENNEGINRITGLRPE